MSNAGELLVGLIYGAPLAGILLEDWQATFTAVGYLGLIIIVFEGKLSFMTELLHAC